MSKFRLIVGVLLIAQGVLVANEKKAPGSLGKKLDEFTLQDHRGKEHRLGDVKDAKAVVLVFLGAECPLAKLYGNKLARLHEAYESKGVAFFGIDSNSQDSLAMIADYVKEHQLKFPVLRDTNHAVADAAGAVRNPSVFVLDEKRIVRYAGRIDDQFGIGFQRIKPDQKDLENALDDLLAGKEVRQSYVEASGCLIGRAKKPQGGATVTYTKHIAPLLNAKCVECHRDGDIGPFSLATYEKASGWADMIAEVIESGQMPPWHADPKHGKFSNDRRLTAEEKKLVRTWADAGAPEGDKKDLPAPPKFPDGEWQMSRKPDAVVMMAKKPFEVKAEGTVQYQYFTADTNFTEDKWIEAMEVLPGARAIVHHILVFATPKGSTGGIEAVGGGVNGFLSAYVPGLRATPYPQGMAKKVPAGSRLIFQVHYTPNGTKQSDLSKIGFWFTDDKKVKQEVRTTSAVNPGALIIPPNAADHKIESKKRINVEGQILAFMPHMHVRGKAFKYEAILPDGKKETLIDIPAYDFNWQTAYRLAEPKTIKPGTIIHCVAAYDNSKNNRSNPDPSARVTWGDQTWNEMMIGYFDIAIDRDKVAKLDEVVIPEGGVPIPEPAKAFLKTYDKNNDGKLDEKEINDMPEFIKKRVKDFIRLMQ